MLKEKSKQLKKIAKELGYEIKLTHAQEILARIDGHKSRHSALLEDKKEQKKDFYYYMINVFYSQGDGFSVVVKMDKDYNFDDDLVIEEAFKQNLLEKEDIRQVIGVEEIDEETFNNYSRKFPELLYPDLRVYAIVSTDDSHYFYEKVDITKDVIEKIEKGSSLYDNLTNYGPGKETDKIFHDLVSLEKIDEIKNYLDLKNRAESIVRFSFEVDEESLENFIKNIKRR